MLRPWRKNRFVRERLPNPFAQVLGEEAAKQTALAIGKTPDVAFSESEEIRRNPLSNQLLAINRWLNDENGVFDHFLELLQEKFNQRRLGDTPSSLRLSLQIEPALGIRVGPVTDEIRKAFGIQRTDGVIVTEAPVRGSPAETAGLRYGDLITDIDGIQVQTARDVTDLIRSAEPGEAGVVTVERDGLKMIKGVTIGARDSSGLFRDTRNNRREIKQQLRGCFPSLGNALSRLADRQDEGRFATLQKVVGNAGLSVTNCSEVIRSKTSGDTSKDVLAKIRGTELQDISRRISRELQDHLPDIFDKQKAKGGGSISTLAAISGLAEEFRGSLKSKAASSGVAIQSISELVDAMSVSQTAACFPPFVEPLKKLATLIQNEETARRQEQGRAQAVVEQRQREQQRQLDSEYARSPEGILAGSYDAYINVRQCYEARLGYTSVYVSEPEMEQAKEAVRLIEQSLKSKLPAVTSTDGIWERVSGKRRDGIGRDYQDYIRRLCGISLGQLTSVLNQQGFGDKAKKKDF